MSLWVSVMNPHRYAFGFAYDFPFAAVIAAVTVLSMLKSRDKVHFPVNATTVLLILFPTVDVCDIRLCVGACGGV